MLLCVGDIGKTNHLQMQLATTLKKRRKQDRTQHAWKKRIEKEISRMRGDLAMIIELIKDNGISDRRKKKIVRRYVIKDEGDIDIEKERLKQKIQVRAQRRKRLKKRESSFRRTDY